MRRRAQWHDHRSESFSDSALPPVQRLNVSLQQRPWTDSSDESGKSHDKPRGQHQDDNRGTSFLYARLARLLRLLRNPRGAGLSHSVGPAAIASRFLAAMENLPSSSRGTNRTGSASAASA